MNEKPPKAYPHICPRESEREAKKDENTGYKSWREENYSMLSAEVPVYLYERYLFNF